MVRPKIFISHSCKDFVLLPASVELGAEARHKRLDFARQVREEIVERLKEDRFEILLDKDRLEPGDIWQAKLHVWLGTCDGAVILLNQESVQSDWVRKEVTILTWRQSLKETLLLVPVILADFDPVDIKNLGFGPLDLLANQAARILPLDMSSENAKLLAAKVVERFENLQTANLDGKMALWVNKIKAKLNEVAQRAPDILDDARKKLGIGDKDWNHFPDQTKTFAYHLLTTTLERAHVVLACFKDVLSDEALSQLINKVIPIWVDAAAAEHFLTDFEATGPSPETRSEARVLALNAEYEETALAYVNRAFCCEISSTRVMGFPDIAGEGQEEETLARIKAGLVKRLKVEGKEKLLKERLKQNPFFVVLNVPKSGLGATLLCKLRSAYSSVTFTLLAGPTFERIPEGEAKITFVKPSLAPGTEDQANNYSSYLQELIEICPLRSA